MPDWGIWMLVAVAFATAELLTVSFFALLFSFGAVVAAVVALFIPHMPTQALVFLAASIVFFWYLRPVLVKLYGKDALRTNVDRIAGMSGVVIQAIDNVHGKGQAKVEGEIWTARSADGEPIAKGERIEVVRVQGVKVIVKRKE